MRLPEIQSRLKEIAAEVAVLAGHISRRKVIARAPVTSVKVDRALAARIKAYKRHHPHWSHQLIATKCGVNPGRVSEVLRGKRT